MTDITRPFKDGSHIEFYDKHQLMLCAKELIIRQLRNPDSLKGIKLPKGMEIIGDLYGSMMYTIKYYGRPVGNVYTDTLNITYLM